MAVPNAVIEAVPRSPNCPVDDPMLRMREPRPRSPEDIIDWGDEPLEESLSSHEVQAMCRQVEQLPDPSDAMAIAQNSTDTQSTTTIVGAIAGMTMTDPEQHAVPILHNEVSATTSLDGDVDMSNDTDHHAREVESLGSFAGETSFAVRHDTESISHAPNVISQAPIEAPRGRARPRVPYCRECRHVGLKGAHLPPCNPSIRAEKVRLKRLSEFTRRQNHRQGPSNRQLVLANRRPQQSTALQPFGRPSQQADAFIVEIANALADQMVAISKPRYRQGMLQQ